MTEKGQKGAEGEAGDDNSVHRIDPTKNVGDLVKAEARKRDDFRDNDKELLDVRISALKEYQDGIRDADNRFQNFAREAESKFHDATRQAETKRIDQLADLRQDFQKTIADMLAESVRSTQSLVAGQLVQIQGRFDSRVSKLEAYQQQSAGRSSVADPALSDALVRMTLGLSNLNTKQDDALSKMTAALAAIQNTESRSGGAMMGRDAGNARFFAIVMAVAAVAGPIIAVTGTILAMRGK